jgi:hypothetical protein
MTRGEDRARHESGTYCGAIDPNRTRYGACCVLLKGHQATEHRDLDGKQWAADPEQPQLPQAMIDRVHGRVQSGPADSESPQVKADTDRP